MQAQCCVVWSKQSPGSATTSELADVFLFLHIHSCRVDRHRIPENIAMAKSSDGHDSPGEVSDREEVKISSNKRRKTANAFVPVFRQDLSDNHDSEGSDYETDDSEASQSNADVGQDTIQTTPDPVPKKAKKLALTLSKEELQEHQAQIARTGVVYLSKVPPFMKPQKVKHLLSEYGETNRIFLAPEDQKSYAKRVRFGGNKRKMFTEGWIEFVDKRKARLVAETLNARKIGGKKGSFYHDDLWNLKYLPKFKWNDLTAQIAAENASRQVRLAAEIEQGKRESKHYLKNAERAKMIKNIQATRADNATISDRHANEGAPEEDMRRQFFQRETKDNRKPIVNGSSEHNKLSHVMSSIFG